MSSSYTTSCVSSLVLHLCLSFLLQLLVKMGTSVVTNDQGRFALGRVGNIIEQLCHLLRDGYQVILVTSGAVGIGRQRLMQQAMLSSSLRTS
jgi:delta-1-pyrroline-5-carboxylate synthetase